jgi:chromosomal replication initiation ATPase DnaA
MGQPDTDLFAALLIRRLGDAGLVLAPDAAAYVAARAERSYGEIERLALHIADAALHSGERLTLGLLGRVLAATDDSDPHLNAVAA